MKLRPLLLPAIKQILANIVRTRFWFRLPPTLTAGATVTNDFFGINIAPSADPRINDYIIERLQECGLNHVRMDFTYDSLNGDAERLLQRLITEKFTVLLDLLPPREDARILADNQPAQQRWQAFVNTVNTRYGEQVAQFEIAATPNRKSWSGFDLTSYLTAWNIAQQLLTNAHPLLAGPNVSDFEPVSNMVLLANMQQQSKVPAIHTDNLFVERVVQPEAYDHRVFDRLLGKIFKLNLVKKARIYQELSQYYGCKQTICSYTGWTSKRLSRFSDAPESRKVNYLLRYLTLVAASNALDRVYWGPLICNRDGLIDDGASGYPEIDQVSFYEDVRGSYENLTIRPAFYALKNIIQRLSNSQCSQAINADNGIHHFIFNRANGTQLHIGWLRDRQVLPLHQLYSAQQLAKARFINGVGTEQQHIAYSFKETPLFLEFNTAEQLKLTPQQIEQLTIPATPVFLSNNTIEFSPVQTEQWRGAMAIKIGENAQNRIDSLLPENLLTLPQLNVHRDQRNIVWSSRDPINPDNTIVIKQNRATGMRKFSYRFKASKGERHWNNASEMIRRGINSPMPIAYFERNHNAGIRDNYYVCQYIANAFSARAAFIAFAQGELSFAGFTKQAIFAALAQYVCKMHNHKIIHNDLTGGNLLMTRTSQDRIEVTAIDIGRATIYEVSNKEVSQKTRLIDLARLCYKLDWPNRNAFMHAYFKVYGREFDSGWSRPLKRYDLKHKIKRRIKGSIKLLK